MKKTLAAAAALTVATLGVATPAYAAAPAVTVNPVAVQTQPTRVVVSGTYRCDGSQASVSAEVFQPLTGPRQRVNAGLKYFPCTGLVEPWSVDAHPGTVLPGPAGYHVVLRVYGPAQVTVADGTLTVV